MNFIKEKIALFIARRMYFKKSDTPLNFKDFIARSKKFLIILPENEADISSSVDVIKHFQLNKKNVSVLVPLSGKSFIPNDTEIFTYSEEDISRLGLPRKDIIVKLTNEKYDVVIDLNLTGNFFSGVVAKSIDCEFIIGFKKENSDEFYNFQIANNENNAEISYRNLLNSLLMFR